MSRLSRRFNWGSELKNINQTLYNQLNDSYFSISVAVNTKSTRMVSDFDPPASDPINAGLDIGDLWVNQKSNTAWIMTSRSTTNSVTWTQIT